MPSPLRKAVTLFRATMSVNRFKGQTSPHLSRNGRPIAAGVLRPEPFGVGGRELDRREQRFLLDADADDLADGVDPGQTVRADGRGVGPRNTEVAETIGAVFAPELEGDRVGPVVFQRAGRDLYGSYVFPRSRPAT